MNKYNTFSKNLWSFSTWPQNLMHKNFLFCSSLCGFLLFFNPLQWFQISPWMLLTPPGTLNLSSSKFQKWISGGRFLLGYARTPLNITEWCFMLQSNKKLKGETPMLLLLVWIIFAHFPNFSQLKNQDGPDFQVVSPIKSLTMTFLQPRHAIQETYVGFRCKNW